MRLIPDYKHGLNSTENELSTVPKNIYNKFVLVILQLEFCESEMSDGQKCESEKSDGKKMLKTAELCCAVRLLYLTKKVNLVHMA